MNKVIIEKNGPVKTVWMNRPEKRNALDTELLSNMIEALQAPVAAERPRAGDPRQGRRVLRRPRHGRAQQVAGAGTRAASR